MLRRSMCVCVSRGVTYALALFLFVALSWPTYAETNDLPERWLPDPNRQLSQAELTRIDHLLSLALCKDEDELLVELVEDIWIPSQHVNLVKHLRDYAHSSMLDHLRETLERLPCASQDKKLQRELSIYRKSVIKTIAAIDTPEAVEVLLDRLGKEDAEGVEATLSWVLREISGKCREDIHRSWCWKKWWEEKRNTYVSAVHKITTTRMRNLLNRSKAEHERLKAADELLDSLAGTGLLAPYFKRIILDTNERVGFRLSLLRKMSRIISNDTLFALVECLRSDNKEIFLEALWFIREGTRHMRMPKSGFEHIPPHFSPREATIITECPLQDWQLPTIEERESLFTSWSETWSVHEEKEYYNPYFLHRKYR